MAASDRGRAEPRARSLFDLPRDFFDSCRLLSPSEVHLGLRPASSSSTEAAPPSRSCDDAPAGSEGEREGMGTAAAAPRWTCHTCRAKFESLQDQRAHFKSDLHRLNVKLSIAGKNTIKEEEFDELESDSLFEDLDISSISDSEDEFEKGSISDIGLSVKAREEAKQKLYLHLQSGDTVSIWKCFLLNESEELALEKHKSNMVNAGLMSCTEGDLIARLKYVVQEPRAKTCLRTMLLVSGGHFAGCVFDGNSIISHKTFHRYVVRAKAGKKQSSKDASGIAAHSAGSSLRRYNEAALKKEIQELLVSWKPYINSSSCIFIYAPSKNRQLLFDGENIGLRISDCVVRYIPFTVRRPTLKEAQRIYDILTHMTYEVNEKASLEEDSPVHTGDEGNSNQQSNEVSSGKNIEITESSLAPALSAVNTELITQVKGEVVTLSVQKNEATPLHEAAKSGNAQLTLELLEQGLNPCIRDERGRTPYMLAKEKEVRNTFRRFMALNLDKWDWHAASVPSPLTKEMEDSQAAKLTEKDAKRKAKAKELKKLRKAKEKAQAQAAQSQNISTVLPQGMVAVPDSGLRQRCQPQRPQTNGGPVISKEEEQKRTLAAEREKRAAAAERRAAVNAQSATMTEAPNGSVVAQTAQSHHSSTVLPQGKVAVPDSRLRQRHRLQQPQFNGGLVISKEEEQKRTLTAEREKREAAAERRISALNAQSATMTEAPSNLEMKSGTNELLCSCCNASLAGKVPFHRYHYKYCSTTCMHVHKDMLEDG